MEKEKLSFLKKVRISIFDFDGYQELAAEKISRTIGYIVLLILIFAIIISLTYTFQFNALIGNVREYINNEISEIKYENYELSIIPNEKQVSSENQVQGNQEDEVNNEPAIEDEQKVMKIDSNELIPAKIIINPGRKDFILPSFYGKQAQTGKQEAKQG